MVLFYNGKSNSVKKRREEKRWMDGWMDGGNMENCESNNQEQRIQRCPSTYKLDERAMTPHISTAIASSPLRKPNPSRQENNVTKDEAG